MLVGHAKRGGRSLTVIDLAAPPVHFFAEAFAPKLLEPEAKFPQLLRIRKQHENPFSALPLENELNESRNKRRILEEWVASAGTRAASAFHEPMNVQAQ